MMLIVKYSIKQVMILNRKCDKDLVKQVDAMLYGYVSVTRFQGLADCLYFDPYVLIMQNVLLMQKRLTSGSHRKQTTPGWKGRSQQQGSMQTSEA